MVDGRVRAAHCFFYERANGPIPDGAEVHHRCEHKPCVNPAHLEALSTMEHAATKDLRATGPKLTRREARQIRTLALEGWRQQDIADTYGVNRNSVSNIKRGKTWA